jgi:hypothetical protein
VGGACCVVSPFLCVRFCTFGGTRICEWMFANVRVSASVFVCVCLCLRLRLWLFASGRASGMRAFVCARARVVLFQFWSESRCRLAIANAEQKQ